ncbi:hypothetical protein HC928_12625, partial [bacterium]|nr:hypothetical protein [bacterium]
MTSKRQRRKGYSIPEGWVTAPERCIRIYVPDTFETVTAVRGQLDRLGLWHSWEKSYQPGDTRAAEIAAHWRWIMAYRYFEDCEGEAVTLDFRPKPGKPCTLQYSKDGGGAWIDAWDISGCGRNNRYATSEILGTTANWSEYNQYQTNITNQYQTNPATFTETFDAAPAKRRRDIMCYVMGGVLEALREVAMDIVREREDNNRRTIAIAAVALGIAAVLAPLTAGASLVALAAFSAPGIAISLSLAAGFTALASDVYTENPGALDNDEAWDRVKCFIMSMWGENRPSEDEFRQVLVGNTLTGDAADIASTVSAGIDSTEAYIS